MKPHFGNDNRNAMADCSTVRPNTMKESQIISESPTELCDDSQSVKDELEPGYIEDRFRVDRKKLEQMLQGNLDHDEESAEEFFQRIMDETSTQITWPSKLKIGAKSKKDPHIKVIGYPEDVKAAKERIMFVLDTKSNRVTLKMDVSHTDHSHVIGKGGNNIKSVMNKTGCHIHFPDSNRGNTVQEKSNQVSIAGQPAGVESARAQIRELLPLVFMFELPVTGVLQPLPDASSPIIQQLQQQYSITISFRQRPRMYVTTVIVRGTVCNAKMVKEGTGRLMEHLTASVGTSIAVSMQLEIAPQHHLFIIGRGGMNIKQIMQQTKASIHFPDPNTATPQRKGTVYITGSIDSVFLARQHLIGCLPLVLMFDVKEEIEMDQARITQLMEQLDVFISVKPKPKQPSKSVIVKSIERNAANMYLARLMLLGLKKDDKNFPPSCIKTSTDSILSPNNGLGLSAFGYFSQNLLSVNTANSLLMINGNKSPTTINSPQNSPHCSSPNHWVTHPPGMYTQMMVLNPNTNVPNQLDLLTQQVKEMNKDLNQNSAFRVSGNQGSTGNIVVHSETNSPSRSPCSSPKGLGRSASAIDLAALQKVNSTFSQMITREASPSSSGHTLDLLGLSKAVGTNPQNPSLFLDGSLSRQTLESSLNRSTLQNGCEQREHMGETDNQENVHVVPGTDMLGVHESSLFPNPYTIVEDYEEKKLKARKAMQKKPEGESRMPTNHWSGMGFSKSMPESAIRERISRNQGGLRYCEPPMETTYETPNETEEVDHDPWRDTNQNNKPINPAPGEYPSMRRKYDYSLSSSNHVDSASLPSTKTWWTHKTDLAELFSKLGLGKYSDLFQQQEIDLATFLTLTDQDLRELGITTFGARRKMLLAIADLNKRRTIMNAHMGSNPYNNTGHTRLDNVSPTDFSENGTTSNFDSNLVNPNPTSNHFSEDATGLEHLQISTSMTNIPFTEKGSPILGIRRGSSGLLSSSSGSMMRGGRLSQSLNQGTQLSQSGHLNLSHSGSLHHSGHLMSHNRLTQSGHFNHSMTDSPFKEKTIKAPPGFPPRNLNSSAGGNLFGGSGSSGLGPRLSPNSGSNPFHDNKPGLSRPDSANLSGHW